MLNCNKCNLHKFRKNRVIGRGEIPCDILMIGEAPGKSEDVRGLPFIGPSGKTLNDAINKAIIQSRLRFEPKIFITNCVQCRPCDEKSGPNREPTLNEFLKCKNNLEEVYIQTKPKKIVFLGKVAEKFIKKIYPGIMLQHPAYINRQGGIGSATFRKFVRELSTIFKEIYQNA